MLTDDDLKLIVRENSIKSDANLPITLIGHQQDFSMFPAILSPERPKILSDRPRVFDPTQVPASKATRVSHPAS